MRPPWTPGGIENVALPIRSGLSDFGLDSGEALADLASYCVVHLDRQVVFK